jgi:mannose-6-phosphate isomerase-like protein (cupin superfamily)
MDGVREMNGLRTRADALAEQAAAEALERRPLPEGEALLKTDPEWLRLRREFGEAVDALALAAEAAPPPGLKERLLSRIAAEESPGLPDSILKIVPGITAVLVDRMPWTASGLLGLEFKVLHRDDQRGYTTRLLRFEPGAKYPAHRHGGTEEVFVVSGSVVLNGVKLSAGDYCRAEGGTEEPMAWSDEGGMAIIVSSDRDAFTEPPPPP